MMMVNRFFRLGLVGLLLCSIIVCSVVSAEDTSQTALELLWKYKTGCHPDGSCGVRDIDISENPRYVAAGSSDRNIYLFTGDGKLLWKYLTPEGVWGVAVPSDGSVVAAASFDGNVYLLNSAGTLIWKKRPGNPLIDNKMISVAISRDGNYIAAGDYNNIYLFNRTGELLWNYSVGKLVHGVAVSDNGKYVTAGSSDQNVYLFTKEGALLWKVQTPFPVHSVAISGKGEFIVGSLYYTYWTYKSLYLFGNDGSLLWNTSALGAYGKVGITDDGHYIAMAGGGNATYLFDRNGTLLWQYFTCNDLPMYPVHYVQDASAVAISDDGSLISVGCSGSDYLKLFRNSPIQNATSPTSGVMPLSGSVPDTKKMTVEVTTAPAGVAPAGTVAHATPSSKVTYAPVPPPLIICGMLAAGILLLYRKK